MPEGIYSYGRHSYGLYSYGPRCQQRWSRAPSSSTRTSLGATRRTCRTAMKSTSYGLYSYGRFRRPVPGPGTRSADSYGLYTRGLRTYCLHRYCLHSYCLHSSDLCSYGRLPKGLVSGTIKQYTNQPWCDAKDLSCFDAVYECASCCSTGRARTGAPCWDAVYTPTRCCLVMAYAVLADIVMA